MCKVVLALACFSCGCSAHQFQTHDDARQHSRHKALATLFLVFNPAGRVRIRNPSRTHFIDRSRPIVLQRGDASRNMDLLQQQKAQVEQLRQRVEALQSQRGQPPEKVSRSPSKSDIILVQGNSLKTWAYQLSPDRVQVVLSTDGRPLEADVQLWQGPDNTPTKIRVYSEDGSVRPFSAVIETPDKAASTVAVRNVGQVEFPLAAYVVANEVDEPISDFRETSVIVQGGALRTFDFDPSVDSVEVMLRTDGRPLNARLELLQGPNNQKTVLELYGEDGLQRPFFAIIETPGSGNVVRVVNTAPMEFPLFASVQPHSINERVSASVPIIGDR